MIYGIASHFLFFRPISLFHSFNYEPDGFFFSLQANAIDSFWADIISVVRQ